MSKSIIHKERTLQLLSISLFPLRPSHSLPSLCFLDSKWSLIRTVASSSLHAVQNSLPAETVRASYRNSFNRCLDETDLGSLNVCTCRFFPRGGLRFTWRGVIWSDGCGAHKTERSVDAAGLWARLALSLLILTVRKIYCFCTGHFTIRHFGTVPAR